MAQTLLQERAARIEDERLRRSLLENVTVHRKLIHEGHRLRAGGLDPQQESDPPPQAQMQHSVDQGHMAGSVCPVLIVRDMGYAEGQLRYSRTASEGMSISRHAVVVQGRLEAPEVAEE